MRLIFAKNRSIASYVIRLFTWSRWHHVGVISNDGKYVIESTSKDGVSKVSITDFNARYDVTRIAEINCDTDKAQSFLLSQLGKKYDWRAILSIVLHCNLSDKNKWFCSELVAAASGIFREERGARITPEHLWAISKDIKE